MPQQKKAASEKVEKTAELNPKVNEENTVTKPKVPKFKKTKAEKAQKVVKRSKLKITPD